MEISARRTEDLMIEVECLLATAGRTLTGLCKSTGEPEEVILEIISLLKQEASPIVTEVHGGNLSYHIPYGGKILIRADG